MSDSGHRPPNVVRLGEPAHGTWSRPPPPNRMTCSGLQLRRPRRLVEIRTLAVRCDRCASPEDIDDVRVSRAPTPRGPVRIYYPHERRYARFHSSSELPTRSLDTPTLWPVSARVSCSAVATQRRGPPVGRVMCSLHESPHLSRARSVGRRTSSSSIISGISPRGMAARCSDPPRRRAVHAPPAAGARADGSRRR